MAVFKHYGIACILALVTATHLHILSHNDKHQTENGSFVGRNNRHQKFLNLFSVIRFSNTPCMANSGINGTCYTKKECGQRAGTVSGSCAGGFGVCCTFTLGCGEMTRENCTYLSTDVSSPICPYTICKTNPEVILLRLDFTEFDIAQPFTCGSSSTPVQCGVSDGPLIGDCIYDSLTVTTPGSPAPPVICGYNTGQHMYVGASEVCNKIVFNMELLKVFNRKWEIKVTQYDSTQDQRFVAPPGCLQWNYGSLGTIQNFNFKDDNSYHLSSQRYSICWRRERGKCSLCFAIGYFGMSNVPSKVPSTSTTSWTKLAGYTDSICCSVDTPTANCGTSGANDFIELEGARQPPSNDVFKVGDGNRFCGRWLGIGGPTTDVPSYTYSAANAARTICTQVLPYRLRVTFSDGEVLSSTAANICGTSRPTAATGDTSDECSQFRLYGNRAGTLGFQLDWWQNDCS